MFPGIEAVGETLKDLYNNAHNIVKALFHDPEVPDEEVEGVSDEIEDVEKDLEEEEEESVAESTDETEEEEAEPEAKEADVSVAGITEAVEEVMKKMSDLFLLKKSPKKSSLCCP